MLRSPLMISAILTGLASGAAAEISFPACQSQDGLEQLIQSEGRIVPDDCRQVTVTPIETPAGDLCMLAFEAEDPGVIGALTEVAVPTEWWVECASLEPPALDAGG